MNTTRRRMLALMGDQWKPDAQWDSRYRWLPVEIGGGTLYLPEPRPWTIDVRTGIATCSAHNSRDDTAPETA